jgi:hypothetical protein
MSPAGQLPFPFIGEELVLIKRTRKRATTPESSRMKVNPAASIAPVPKANRQSTELAANAASAHEVNKKTFSTVFQG